MSYEGYEQHVCQNGHRFDTWCSFMFDDDEHEKCPDCGANSVYINAVDDTNCDQCGHIEDWSSLLLTATEVQVCNLGHTHVTKNATYKVPSDEEAAALRALCRAPDPTPCKGCGNESCDGTCHDS